MSEEREHMRADEFAIAVEPTVAARAFVANEEKAVPGLTDFLLKTHFVSIHNAVRKPHHNRDLVVDSGSRCLFPQLADDPIDVPADVFLSTDCKTTSPVFFRSNG